LTLFATHHHELTDTAAELPDATNLHFDATRAGGDVTFDHEVASGAATASYGIEVAKMAGVPDRVVERARDLLEADEKTDPRDDATNDRSVPPEFLAELESVDLATTTPLEAFDTLADLKEQLEDS
jgi:DNA mismatch repair protein MutS